MPYENVRLLGKFRKKSQLAADLQVRRRPDLTDMLHSLSLQQGNLNEEIMVTLCWVILITMNKLLFEGKRQDSVNLVKAF